MKKIIIVLLAAVLFSQMTYAQKVASDKVPAAVTSAFTAKFPGASKPSWMMQNGSGYEATFKLNNEDVTANFDASGKWQESNTKIKATSLPPAVQTTLTKDFAGYKTNEASKVAHASTGNSYEAQIQKGEDTYDVSFGPDGKVLNKTKVEKEKTEKTVKG